MRNNAISSFCERYVSNALRKYETTGIKTPIPFYIDVAKYNYQWCWYDTKTPVTMQELKGRGIM